jgi:Zn-dependent protease with chaperone function
MRKFTSKLSGGIAVTGLVLVLPIAGVFALAQKSSRTPLKPANLIFLKPKQDIELGQQASKDVEKELNLIATARVNAYVSALGKQLAGYAPGEKYPYQFKVVDDKQINAFALPGGFIYINRGIFENADVESQLAGVVAHEIGHVALRHSASRVSQAMLTQTGLAILGGLIGNSTGDILAKVGMKGMDLLLLKNSREAETQADLLGTQLLYDGGYDTKGMVEFFEKIEAADKGGGGPQFLSDHPNPDNRIDSVKKEIEKLGGSRPNPLRDTAEFQAVKALVKNMSAPKPNPKPADKPADKPASPTTTMRAPAPPSSRYVQAVFGDVVLSRPENWQATGRPGDVTLAPNGGLVSGGLTHGMIVATFTPAYQRNRKPTIEQATDQLIAIMQRSNTQLRVSGRRSVRIGGQSALSVELANQSPTGEREIDVLVSVLRPNGVLDYFVAVAPQKDFAQYQDTFNKILLSVTFR